MSTRKPTPDLTGSQFGKWTVLSFAFGNNKSDRAWMCKCECGTIKPVGERELLRGRSLSCGCSRKGKLKPKQSKSNKDRQMIGKRFGRWTVISRADDYVINAGNHYDQWLCRCDCGNERLVLGSNLTTGKSTSCGCYKAEQMKVLGKNNRLEPRCVTLSDSPSVDDIMQFLEVDSMEEAIIKMFPSYWQKRVRDEQTILRRYGNTENNICENCGETAKLEMHHIIPVSRFGGNEKGNVRWLCKKCHAELTKERFNES